MELPATSPFVSPEDAGLAVALGNHSQAKLDDGPEVAVGEGLEAHHPDLPMVASLESEKHIPSKIKKRLGLPSSPVLLAIITVVVVVLTAVLVGAIIGTRHHSTHTSATATTTAYPPQIATATPSWADVSPLPTGETAASVPLGRFEVPMQFASFSSGSCVVDAALTNAWGCEMTPNYTIMDLTRDGSSNSVLVTLDTNSVSPPTNYGSQLPYLDSQNYSLYAALDKDAQDLGPALVFWTLFDKLTILPAGCLNNYTSTKRSLSAMEIQARNSDCIGGSGQVVQVGDRPWFCWFNQTVLELLIYNNEPTPTLTASSSPTSTVLHANDYPNYQRYVKIIMKRKSDNFSNIQPYCQQMQLMDDGSTFAAEGVPIINVSETEPSPGRGVALDSNCACEWLYTG